MDLLYYIYKLIFCIFSKNIIIQELRDKLRKKCEIINFFLLNTCSN